MFVEIKLNISFTMRAMRINTCISPKHNMRRVVGVEKCCSGVLRLATLKIESDWWDVGLVVQKARKQGTVC